jgi:hypothetical protein
MKAAIIMYSLAIIVNFINISALIRNNQQIKSKLELIDVRVRELNKKQSIVYYEQPSSKNIQYAKLDSMNARE